MYVCMYVTNSYRFLKPPRFKEILSDIDRIQVALDRLQRVALVNTIIILWATQNIKKLLIN